MVLVKTKDLLVKGEEIVVAKVELQDLTEKGNGAVYERKGF